MKINNKKIQKNILRSTERLFVQYGIKGWNMDTIAYKAGMTKNTLYKIVGSKEQLLEKIVIQRLRRNIEAIVDIFKNNEKFLEAAEAGTRYLAHHISVNDLRTLPQIFREYPSIKEKFDAISEQLSTSIHHYLSEAKRKGIIKKNVDFDILISSVTAIINHFLLQNYPGKEFEERLQKAFSYLLRGIIN